MAIPSHSNWSFCFPSSHRQTHIKLVMYDIIWMQRVDPLQSSSHLTDAVDRHFTILPLDVFLVFVLATTK